MRHTPVTTGHELGVLRHVLILSVILGFSALLFGGFLIFKNQAPVPRQVVSPTGEVLATNRTIKGGQAVYMKYGLMNDGTVL